MTWQAGVESYENLLVSLEEGHQQSGSELADYVLSEDWMQRVKGKQDSLVALSNAYPYVYDICLIGRTGDIIYTVEHEDDFGSNLFEGPYSQTKFSKVAQAVLVQKKTLFSDIERYAPSNSRPDGFIAAPIFADDARVLGVFAIQIRLEQLISLLSRDLANINACQRGGGISCARRRRVFSQRES